MDPKFLLKLAQDTGADSGGTKEIKPEDGKEDLTKTIETLAGTLKTVVEKVNSFEALLTTKKEEPAKKEENKEEIKKDDKGNIDFAAFKADLIKEVKTVVSSELSGFEKKALDSSLSEADKAFLKTIPGSESFATDTIKAILAGRVVAKTEDKEDKGKKPQTKSPTVGDNKTGVKVDAYEEANKKRKGIK